MSNMADLDFMGMVKLVNYVRSEVAAGNALPDVSASAAFRDDHYLKPVLDDDALLYSLNDIIEEGYDSEHDNPSGAATGTNPERIHDREARMQDLESKLQRTQLELEARKEELKAIKRYLGTSFDEEPERGATDQGNSIERPGNESNSKGAMLGNTDSSYFASYSGHGSLSKIQRYT